METAVASQQQTPATDATVTNVNQETQVQQDNLSSTNNIHNPTSDIQYSAFSILNNRWLKGLISLALTLQGLYGLYVSSRFVLVEFPMLEERLSTHVISADEVRAVAAEAITIVISTIITMFFALEVSVSKTKFMQRLSMFVGVIVFFANAYLYNFLQTLPLIEIWTSFISNLI